jgi:hypothetical protein
MKMNKKGQDMSGLQGFLLGLAGVAIVLAIALLVLAELKTAADDPTTYCRTGYTANASEAVTSSSYCVNTSVGGGPVLATRTTAYNATGSIMDKLSTIPTWVGIVIVVALAFIVLGFFYVKSNMGGMGGFEIR